MKRERYCFSSLLKDDYVYVFGGRSYGEGIDPFMSHCERFNLITRKWETIT